MCPCAMNQLGGVEEKKKRAVWKHPPLCGSRFGLHRHTSSRPLQQLGTGGDGWNKSTQRRVYPTYRSRMMAFTFHSCSDRRGPPLLDAVRCSCESDPAVRSCPLNRLSPAKSHASQLGHWESNRIQATPPNSKKRSQWSARNQRWSWRKGGKIASSSRSKEWWISPRNGPRLFIYDGR